VRKPRIALAHADAQRLVKRIDPAQSAQDVTALLGGEISAVFEVRCSDGQSVVIKVYSDSFHWKMQKEVFVYGLLQAHGVDAAVARILLADDSKSVLPYNILALTKLEGALVSALDSLDDRALADIYRQMGELLRTLHQITFDAFGYVGTDGIETPHRTNLSYMELQFAKKRREFEELGGDRELSQRFGLHVAEREHLFAGCHRAVLCHNDCHEGNVLVVPGGDGWRVSGLVDFENVVAGDPLLDLAKSYYYSPRGEEVLDALVAGYGELRDGWREALDLYVLYHVLELWDWFARLGDHERLPSITDDLRRLIA
jgi:aminoglycoside phosphotransferase (APT) family kinase protein